MSATNLRTRGSRIGRPLVPRPARVLLPKAKSTISIDQTVDQAFRERADDLGTTYSGLVEAAMRQALGMAS